MTKKRILVVDDEMYIVNILDFTLATDGLEVVSAANGEEALKSAIERTPDLVILDVMMPKIDGFEVCRALRAKEETKHVPIILLTAKDRETDKAKGKEAGADLYVTKPFSPTRLLDEVRNLLGIEAID